ncbi:DJ-1/PfpI family protein [Chromobacterium subtsugae]|uniref:DJ-1/PfpI family protein n=1 Tax=Chromobacterium subtsugae TaxID=251747 RepID=UPI000A6064BD|nr:DJ-1/PfpI family protein [Chromobacterium subtsugae]
MSIPAPRSGLGAWVAALALLGGCASAPQASNGFADADGKLPSYQPRPGHERPLIAVFGENSGTELSDFTVPYGVLSESGAADVVAVSTRPGPIATFTDMGKPGFRILGQATLAAFDASHPDGADYVIVPALRETPEALSWLALQAGKGATLVSICNGGMVVADTGLMAGRRATAHWSTEAHRLEHHAAVRWVRNARYVADGNWISTAGVSAALPASLALVEAIAGTERAQALARQLGSGGWSARHDSDAFHPQPGVNLLPLAQVAYLNRWLHAGDAYALPAADGADETTLALTLDAYSSTGRSRAYLTAAADTPLRTRHGLFVLPDRVQGAADAPASALPAIDGLPPGQALDRALDGIAARYGRATARGVALVFEYPDFQE